MDNKKEPKPIAPKEDFDAMLAELQMVISMRHEALRTEISDMVIVDTCNTMPNGWETAISIDGDKSYVPVERYPSKEAATERHPFWVSQAEQGFTTDSLAKLSLKMA
jgi:hypothetical protein